MSNQVIDKVANEVMLRKVPEKIETPAPVSPDEETKKLEAKAKKTEESAVELTEGAKRIQKIVVSIDLRQQERARLVAVKLRRGIEMEREQKAAESMMENALNNLAADYKAKVDAVRGAFQDIVDAHESENAQVLAAVGAIDKSLEQMRKQLDAELGKMGAKVTA